MRRRDETTDLLPCVARRRRGGSADGDTEIRGRALLAPHSFIFARRATTRPRGSETPAPAGPISPPSSPRTATSRPSMCRVSRRSSCRASRSGRALPIATCITSCSGRGREATLTAAGRSMRCHAVGRPGEPPRAATRAAGSPSPSFPTGIPRLRETHEGGDPVLDLGQWFQEVDGGVCLVLRGDGGAVLFSRSQRRPAGRGERHRTGSRAQAGSDRGQLPARRPLSRDARTVACLPNA